MRFLIPCTLIITAFGTAAAAQDVPDSTGSVGAAAQPQTRQSIRFIADGTLEIDGARAQLDGAVPFDRSEVCTATDGRRWACGMRSQAAWNNYFKTNVQCAVSDGIASCVRDGEPSDLWLLRNGWAATLEGEAGFPRLAAYRAAQQYGLGVFSPGVPPSADEPKAPKTKTPAVSGGRSQ
ncbi:hypothetical protein [Flaviflagellibacter deserti]|uniref:Endonuclease YncB(Thermonuclease family) n=1 Tax=Flaviflagellibacter deserti TaxID=2267266 RepID=A0ABV9Z5P9_9HYPH